MQEILDYLNGIDGGFEASEVRTFDLYIANFPVRVEVHDHGAGSHNLRYSVHAYSPDIPEADRQPNTHGESVGNPDADLTMALMNVHWNVFQHRSD